jgi:hypothetical protein
MAEFARVRACSETITVDAYALCQTLNTRALISALGCFRCVDLEKTGDNSNHIHGSGVQFPALI